MKGGDDQAAKLQGGPHRAGEGGGGGHHRWVGQIHRRRGRIQGP
jgi:hypothetical protein